MTTITTSPYIYHEVRRITIDDYIPLTTDDNIMIEDEPIKPHLRLQMLVDRDSKIEEAHQDAVINNIIKSVCNDLIAEIEKNPFDSVINELTLCIEGDRNVLNLNFVNTRTNHIRSTHHYDYNKYSNFFGINRYCVGLFLNSIENINDLNMSKTDLKLNLINYRQDRFKVNAKCGIEIVGRTYKDFTKPQLLNILKDNNVRKGLSNKCKSELVDKLRKIR